MNASAPEIRRIRPGRPHRRLDALFAEARSALLRPGERLEPIAERALDAETDPRRILIYARIDRRPVGALDAELHAPGPGDLTIAQLAVAPAARRRGVARALVAEAVRRAERRAGPLASIQASVFRDNFAALDFWQSLGLEIIDEQRGVVTLARFTPGRFG